MANNNAKKDKGARIGILVATLVLAILFISLGSVFLALEISDRDYDYNYGGNGGSNGYTVSGSLSTSTSGTRVYLDSNYVYYSFTPSYSGNYTFYTSSVSDTDAILYNSNWSELSKDTSSSPFVITTYLTSGRTYYIGMKMYNGSSNVYVYVTRSYS